MTESEQTNGLTNWSAEIGEFLDKHELSKRRLAKMLKTSDQVVYGILKGTYSVGPTVERRLRAVLHEGKSFERSGSEKERPKNAMTASHPRGINVVPIAELLVGSGAEACTENQWRALIEVYTFLNERDLTLTEAQVRDMLSR